MNILIINHYAGSPDMGMEFRPYYFAKEWIKLGHKVSIIAADYSHLRRVNPVVYKDFQKEEIDSIDYYWIKTNEYEGNGTKRAMSMAKFVSKLWFKSKWILKNLRPDLVICSSTYPLDTYIGQRLRKLSKNKVKYVHELHDVWPQTLLDIGGLSKNHPFIVAMQRGENSAYKNCDSLISLLGYTKEHCMEHGLEEGKYTHIPPAIDTDDWQIGNLNEHHKNILEHLRKDKFIVGYFGGHALSNALDVLLDIAKEAEKIQDDLHFVLVGSGVEKAKLIEKSKNLNLSNISFLDPISKNEIPSLLDYFDCIYMGTYDSPLYKFGMGLNKMTDTMLSGKPSVCAITSPPTWIELADSGIVVPSEDVQGALEAILKIYRMDEAEIVAMGQRGRQYAKNNLDIKILAKKFLEVSFK